MASIIKFTLIMIIIIITIMNVNGQQRRKSCNMKQIDYCLTNFYYNQYGIPINERQLKRSCQTTRTMYECLMDFGQRCMSSALRETFILVLDSVTKQVFDICNKPINHPDRLEIFHHAACLNRNAQKIGKCSEKTRDILFYTIESSFWDRIPIFCCNIRSIFECSRLKTKELCGNDAAIFAQDRSNPFRPLFEGICSYYQLSTRQCRNRMLPFGWKTNEDPRSPIYRMINSFF
ncbi:hypothetical protein DERP_013676 [Dermatophagoides pteronyssinus]|uniref:DUF19 domain-containing protein n=1 Tax=Dermatophagoides pteronyssinus TaxID=6956 RepID=A0ABQ8JV85_DERPT|nr:hypothetical protein DERP_013676 [Dermatophagoides pteronyssinus]